MNTGDRLFIVAVVLVLTLALFSAWYNFDLENKINTGARTVNLRVINEQIKSGNLSMHPAEFSNPIREKQDEGHE